MPVSGKRKAQTGLAEPLAITPRMIPAQIGTVSLMRVWALSFPTWHGNNFYFEEGSYRCSNMNAENLAEARSRFLPDGLVAVDIVNERWAVVTDTRIPQNWLRPWPDYIMPEALIAAVKPRYAGIAAVTG